MIIHPAIVAAVKAVTTRASTGDESPVAAFPAFVVSDPEDELTDELLLPFEVPESEPSSLEGLSVSEGFSSGRLSGCSPVFAI